MTNPDQQTAPAQVLALQGSPRRKGNTDRLLETVLETIESKGVSTEKIMLRDLQISPCLEIGECMTTGNCAIQDDMTPVYDRLTGARVVILASPIFFYGPSAHLKAAIDRCQALWARKYMLKKEKTPPGRGVVISAAATRGKKLFDGFLMTARYFFDVLNLSPGWELLARGVDEAGDVDKVPEIQDQARRLGLEIAAYILENPVSGPR